MFQEIVNLAHPTPGWRVKRVDNLKLKIKNHRKLKSIKKIKKNEKIQKKKLEKYKRKSQKYGTFWWLLQ